MSEPNTPSEHIDDVINGSQEIEIQGINYLVVSRQWLVDIRNEFEADEQRQIMEAIEEAEQHVVIIDDPQTDEQAKKIQDLQRQLLESMDKEHSEDLELTLDEHRADNDNR